MSQDYTPPTSHKSLRALLGIVDYAVSHEDTRLLDYAWNLVDSVVTETKELLYIRQYINQLQQRIQSDEHPQYRLMSDFDVTIASEHFRRMAYGDFDEAMQDLEYDLRTLDTLPEGKSLASDVYDSELFDDEGDNKIWGELRAVALKWAGKRYSEASEREALTAVKKLRGYQQKSYGALVPVITVTYLRKVGDDTVGVGVQAAWMDEGLHITTHAPFYEELDDFFINQSPVESRKMFTPDCFPKSIGGYELSGTTIANLFRHEL